MPQRAVEMITQNVSVSELIRAAPSDVWPEVSNPAGWERWIEFLIGSRVEGDGAGATRVCHTDSGDIHEVVEVVDHDSMTFEYTISSAPMPITNARGRIQLAPAGGGAATEVTWSMAFDTPAETAADVKENIEAIYRSSIGGLERLVRKSI